MQIYILKIENLQDNSFFFSLKCNVFNELTYHINTTFILSLSPSLSKIRTNQKLETDPKTLLFYALGSNVRVHQWCPSHEC